VRILITGVTGYLGGYLAHRYDWSGAEIHATHRATSALRQVEIPSIVWHDVVRGSAAIVADAKPDVILHTATHYGRGADVADVERANLTWPLELIDAAAAQRVPLFVNIDTSLPPAISAYARTKRAFAEAAKARAIRGDIRVLNIRLESVYGPQDGADKFQSVLLGAIYDRAESFSLTPGAQTRDYIYVDDAADAIVLLIEHARSSGEAWLEAGVGAGREVTIREFAETMVWAAEENLVPVATRLDFGALPYREGELMHACADISLLNAIGWKGARSLRRGLCDMIRKERILE